MLRPRERRARRSAQEDRHHHGLVAGTRRLDPAYVHVTQRSIAEHRRVADLLADAGVYTVGRYGGWTYCSIEDNLIETRALARELAERWRAAAPSD
jgi:hypothetical protein